MDSGRQRAAILTLEGVQQFSEHFLSSELDRLNGYFTPRLTPGPSLMVPEGVGPGASSPDPSTVTEWASVCIESLDNVPLSAWASFLDSLAGLGAPVALEALHVDGALCWSLAVPRVHAAALARMVSGCLPGVVVRGVGEDRLAGVLAGVGGVDWFVDVGRSGVDVESVLSEPETTSDVGGVFSRLVGQCRLLVGLQVVLVPLADGWHEWVARFADALFVLRSDLVGGRLVAPSVWQGGEHGRVLDRLGGRARRFWSVAVRAFAVGGVGDCGVEALGLWLSRLVVGGRSCVVFRLSDCLGAGVDVRASLLGRWCVHVGSLANSAELSRSLPLPTPSGARGVASAGSGVCGSGVIRVGVGLRDGLPAVVGVSALRAGGAHVLGSSGCGKTTFLETVGVEACRVLGAAGVVVDLHGDFAPRIAGLLRGVGVRVWALDGSRDDVPPLNFLSPEGGARVSWWIDGVVMAFRAAYVGSWGARLEHVLRSTLLSLAHVSGTCLGDALVLLGRGARSLAWRRRLLERLPEELRRFWRDDLTRYRGVEVDAVVNKLARLVLCDGVKSWFVSRESRWEWLPRLQGGEWVVVRLPVGVLGEGVACTVASLVALVVAHVGMSRGDGDRRACLLVMDEAHRLADGVAGLVCEGRKFGVIPVFAHQALSQVSREVAGVLGGAGVGVVFRPSGADLRWASEALLGRVDAGVLSRLGVGECAVRSGGGVQLVEVARLPDVGGGRWEDLCLESARAFGTTAAVACALDGKDSAGGAARRRSYDDI